MVHKMQFSGDCMQRRGCKPRQQKENQGHTKGKKEKIFIDHYAENGIYRCVLYQCKALRQQ